MRKVFIKISDFKLELGEKVTIRLLDALGKELTSVYKEELVSLSQEIEVKSDVLELELYENDLIQQKSFYELKIKNIKFKFTIKTHKDNTPHELTSLISLGGIDTIAYIKNDDYVFDNDFVKKFEIKLLQQEPYFTHNQNRVFNFFVFYANFVKAKEETIDICESLDIYLGSIE